MNERGEIPENAPALPVMELTVYTGIIWPLSGHPVRIGTWVTGTRKMMTLRLPDSDPRD